MSLIKYHIVYMLFYMVLALPIYIVLRYVYLKKCNKRFYIKHEMILALFIIYSIGIASQTILPGLAIGRISETGAWYFNLYKYNGSINLQPFFTIKMYAFDWWNTVSFINLVANVVLFSPFGFLAPFVWKRMNSYPKVFFFGLGITLFIEITQLFTGRSTDIDDVILNTIGVVLGFWMYKLIKPR